MDSISGEALATAHGMGAGGAEPCPPAAGPDAAVVYRFDDFELQPALRTLLQRGKPMRLGSRAFDLLVALCRRAGAVVSNRELLAAAWPNRVVEEGSVRVHIATLRKTLGDGVGHRRLIANVPMRGYCFVAPIESGALPAAADPAPPVNQDVPPGPAAPGQGWRLPLQGGLVGRTEEASDLMQALHRHRCVTLVGAGGIGKTSMALPAARAFAQAQDLEAVLVELASLQQVDRVASAIASALGVVVPDQDPLAAMANNLGGGRRLLLVLDNCEHVIDGVAAVAEYLLGHSVLVRLLATSREPLRIQGEWVQRLGPLRAPPPALQGRLAEAMQYPAVQLFVERAAAAGGLAMTDEDVPLVCSICRRLDGIPLAIELAAGAIEAVGLRGLVERLGSRLGGRLVMVGRGRRTASPRHQTLRATLDWSHALLPAEEQALLAQLSVFRGVFTLAGALAVSDGGAERLDECLAGLVSKSMVVSERVGDAVVYRLLETTREYAAERLAASPVQRQVALRHAGHLLARLNDEQPDEHRDDRAGDGLAVAHGIDDLRQAVSWCLSDAGTHALGLALVARSAPLWFRWSMLIEYRELAERALSIIDAMPPGQVDDEAQMRICEALGQALWHTRAGGQAMTAAFSRSLVIAERLQAKAFRLRCRWGLWLVCNAEGDYAGSLRLAEQFGDIIAGDGDPAVQLTHERMMALGSHFQGDQWRARSFAGRVLQRVQGAGSTPARHVGDSQFDPRVAALTVLARTLWMQGWPQQAMDHAQGAVDEALRSGDPLSLAYAIAIGAAPVAFWCGRREQASEWVALLNDRAGQRSLRFWQGFGEGYRQLIDLGQSSPPRGHGHSQLGSGLGITVREVLCTIHPLFLDAALMQRAHTRNAGWCTAELLRVMAEDKWGTPAMPVATILLQQALEVAREQQALAWELRASTSLARLLLAQGKGRQALATLEPVLARCREGHDMPDLRRAHALVAQACSPEGAPLRPCNEAAFASFDKA